MKIGDSSENATTAITNVNPVSGGGAQASVQNQKSSNTAAASAPSSTVNLSATAQQLASPTNDGDVDTSKVASVQSAIAQGTYQVNHQAIADKLISNAQELLSKSSG